MTFSYDGSCFKGYQRQHNLKTVQGVIENELSLLNEKAVTISSSGRTDKGVHARCQKAHFDLDKSISCYNIKTYLNRKLNNEIHISDVIKVNDCFHARYDVLKKEYRYFINMGFFDVFKRNYVYQYNKSLNISKMKDVCSVFMGTHNFKSFCNDSNERENFERTIYDISLNVKDDILEISIIGNGFLKQMVRNIVGVLIKVGEDKLTKDQVKDILVKEDRCYNIKSAPACGLYLWDVTYKNDIKEA